MIFETRSLICLPFLDFPHFKCRSHKISLSFHQKFETRNLISNILFRSFLQIHFFIVLKFIVFEICQVAVTLKQNLFGYFIV